MKIEYAIFVTVGLLAIALTYGLVLFNSMAHALAPLTNVLAH